MERRFPQGTDRSTEALKGQVCTKLSFMQQIVLLMYGSVAVGAAKVWSGRVCACVNVVWFNGHRVSVYMDGYV